MSDEPEALAQRFHETYERLAPSFGYETREASAKPWADVPEQNRALMTAVCAEILATLAEVATPDGALERLHSGCPAWGPGSGYVHISEVEMATLTDERDRLQRDRDNLTIMFNDEVRWRNAANNRAGVLRVRLMQAERVVKALAASLDWVRADACATCAQGVCSAHQPAAGVIAATARPDN